MDLKPGKGCVSCGEAGGGAGGDAATAAIQDAIQGRRSNVKEFIYSTPRTTFTALQAQVLTIPTYSDSFFVVTKLVALSTGTFTGRFYNGSTGRVLQDVAVNNVNLFGTIQLPNVLRDPIVLPPSSNFQLQITDTSNSGNVVQCSLVGYRWYDMSKYPLLGKAGARLDWYQYSASVVLAANGSGSAITRIDADADFLVRKVVGNRTGAYTLQISDSAAADTWEDQLVSDANAVGTAQYPYLLSKPRLVGRNSTLSVNFNDVSGSGNTVQLIYEGAKIYR